MMRERVIKALMELGYSRGNAIELIAKYEDVYEVNVEDNQSPEAIAETLEEQLLQEEDS